MVKRAERFFQRHFRVGAVRVEKIDIVETETPQRSLLVYATLGIPMVVALLMLLLVAVSRSYDSFAGFGLLLAADAGRNFCEWLRNRGP